MTDHSEARVEAAAKALHAFGCPDGCPGSTTDYLLAGHLLAAADEIDRAASVVRIDTNDEALMESAADWISDMYVTDPELRYNVVLAFRALATLSGAITLGQANRRCDHSVREWQGISSSIPGSAESRHGVDRCRHSDGRATTGRGDTAMTGLKWIKSSYSNGSSACVQVRPADDAHGGLIGVRNSRTPDGSTLWFTHAEWDAFYKGMLDGEFQ